MAKTTIVKNYSVGSKNAPIKLKVTMSNMVIGRSTLKINGGNEKKFDDSFELALGSADDLLDSKITIDTSEVNIDKTKPGNTDFTIELSGGPDAYSETKNKEVAVGEAALYTAEIRLV